MDIKLNRECVHLKNGVTKVLTTEKFKILANNIKKNFLSCAAKKKICHKGTEDKKCCAFFL